MSLPITTSAFDKLGRRLRLGQMQDGDEAVWLDVFDAYQQSLLDVSERLSQLGYGPTVTRVKSRGTLVDKLRRTPGIAVSKVRDVAGARLLAQPISIRAGVAVAGEILTRDVTIDEGRLAQGIMAETIIKAFTGSPYPRPAWISDLCEAGKDSHGYRALHIIVYPDGMPVEIQLRTRIQHAWAEISERLGDMWGREFRYGQRLVEPDRAVRPSSDITRSQAIDILMKLGDVIAASEVHALAVDQGLVGLWVKQGGQERLYRQYRDVRAKSDIVHKELRATLGQLGGVFGIGGEGG